MNTNTFKYTLLLSLFSLSVLSSAQDKKDQNPPAQQPPAGGTLIEEIEVVRPYKPVLADAVKIRRNPDMNTVAAFKPILTYNIIDKKLDLNTNIKELQAQKMADEPAVVLVNNYAKVGAGNFNTTLGEVYLNTGRDEALQGGAFFKHLSQKGNLSMQQFSKQEFGLFGRSVADDYVLSGRLIYDRNATNFYGFDPASSIPADMSKQRFSTIGAEAEIANNYSESSSFNYSANINAYQFSNIDDARESSVLLRSSLNKAVKQSNIGVNASIDMTSTKDLAYKVGNNILRANPYVKLKASGFNLDLGVNIVQEFGTQSRLNIFPAVSAELPIIVGYATIFAGVNGDVLKTNLRELAFENPYLNKNIAIKNSLEKMNVYGGIKGNASAEFGYKIMASYKTMEDMQLFVNSPALINRFETIYDNGQSKILSLEGEINVKASEFLNMTAKAQLFDYTLATQQEAWFKPKLRLMSNARFQINRKVIIDAEALLQEEVYARVNGSTPGTFTSKSINGFIDLSAGAEYKVNEKFGVYIRANNLTGQTYQRFLFYPKLGMNVLGGLNYAF
jgi:outer membrane cobalamin receptor